jgi:hypothetical protein
MTDKNTFELPTITSMARCMMAQWYIGELLRAHQDAQARVRLPSQREPSSNYQMDTRSFARTRETEITTGEVGLTFGHRLVPLDTKTMNGSR